MLNRLYQRKMDKESEFFCPSQPQIVKCLFSKTKKVGSNFLR